MSTISTYCPRCHHSLEIPDVFDNVICPACATAYWIRRSHGAINLSERWPETEDLRRGENALAVADSRLAKLDELIEEAEQEIESLRSKEQGAPLQKGCSFFGLFTMVILVIALFMILGRRYVGSWPFFACVAVVVLLSLFRMRRKQIGIAQLQDIRRQRLDIEDGLAQLLAERDRIQKLKTILSLEEPK